MRTPFSRYAGRYQLLDYLYDRIEDWEVEEEMELQDIPSTDTNFAEVKKEMTQNLAAQMYNERIK